MKIKFGTVYKNPDTNLNKENYSFEVSLAPQLLYDRRYNFKSICLVWLGLYIHITIKK